MTNAGGAPGSTRTLLVVDDEPQILTAIADLLEDDFIILTAADGPGALALLARTAVTVILSDQRMPGMSGDEFLRRARELSEATRVLLTGYTDIQALIRAVNVGKIHAYVQKPWNPVELRTVILNAALQFELHRDLAHERRLLGALMDNIPDSIAFTDGAGRFERVNRAYAAVLGIADPAAAEGRSVGDFLPAEVADRVAADDRRVLDDGTLILDKIDPVPGPQGRPGWVSTTKAPIRNRHGEVVGLVGIGRDVTRRRLAEQALQRAHQNLEATVAERTCALTLEIAERKRAEEALLQAKELAESASRAKTAFLANMSHELRTPLNAIIGFADLMRAHVLGPVGCERYEEYVQNIFDSGMHLLHIISDILDVSRIEAGKIPLHESDVDLGSMINAAWRLVEQQAQRSGLTATVRIDPELPLFHGDERLLKQATLNLLSNAVKFTPAGGTIGIDASRSEDGGVVVVIRDSGIGIAAEDIDGVIRPFGQVDNSLSRKHAGTGLGLPLTKAFIELHDGDFCLSSAVGAGTTAVIRLPPERIRNPLSAGFPHG